MSFAAPPTGQRPAEPHLDEVLGDLSHVLWRLRELTSVLVYRLEVQQLVLLSGRVRWINFATEDVDRCLDAIRIQETVRLEALGRLAPLLGTSVESSLRELCEVVPPPWDVVLGEHHSEFLVLSAEAEEAAQGNRELMHQGLSDVREFLDSMRGRAAESTAEQSYGARAGAAGPATPADAVLVDRDV